MSAGQRNPFPTLANWKLAALILGIVAAVFGLLYVAQFVPPNHPVLRSVLQSAAALLLTSGIVSVIINVLVRRELASFWLTAIGIRDSISEGGLQDIGLDFSSYDFHTLIRDASKIDFCVIHADKWIGSRIIDFKEFLAHKDHELRVCLLDEGAACGPILSADFNYKEGDLAVKISNGLESIRSCIADLEGNKQSTGRVRVWKHRRVPKHTLYRFDDLVYLVPYNISAGRTKIPVLGFSIKQGGIATFLISDFEQLLTDQNTKLVYDSRQGLEKPEEQGSATPSK